MTEQRGERGDIDACRSEPILERRVGHDPGRARHRPDAIERHQDELRIGGRQPLMPQQGIGDAPAFVELSDQIFGRHNNIVEEYLAEFVVAGDRLDRPDPDAGAVQIDQEEADAGMARLRLRVGADQRDTSSRE